MRLSRARRVLVAMVFLPVLFVLVGAVDVRAHRALRVGDLNVTLEVSRVQGNDDGHEHLDEDLVPGRYEFRLYVQDVAHNYAPVEDARIEVHLARGGRPSGSFLLVPAGEGGGVYVGRAELSQPGDWTLVANVERPGQEAVSAEFALVVVPGSHEEGGFGWVEGLLLGLAGLAALWVLRQLVALRRGSASAPHP